MIGQRAGGRCCCMLAHPLRCVRTKSSTDSPHSAPKPTHALTPSTGSSLAAPYSTLYTVHVEASNMERGEKIGYVYTKKSTSKSITQIALDGEFTYSQACGDESTASHITILPSIAITHASPSAKRKSQNECLQQEVGVSDGGSSGYSHPVSSHNSTPSVLSKKRSSSAGSLVGNRVSANLPTWKSLRSEPGSHGSDSQRSGSMRCPPEGKLLLSSSPSDKYSTAYFCDDDGRLSYKGILFPKLLDNFGDVHLESAYQKYSHRQRQKSLLILNLIDMAVKMGFFVALLIRIRDFSGRMRIPIQELIYILPWIMGNALVIGLITCWNKCANHYLHVAAVLTIALFTLESHLVFGVAAPTSFSIASPSAGSVWHTMFVVFGIYSMMPLPLTWCVIAGSFSCVLDLLITLIFTAVAVVKDNTSYTRVSSLPFESLVQHLYLYFKGNLGARYVPESGRMFAQVFNRTAHCRGRQDRRNRHEISLNHFNPV